jgi:hypothetical protein
MQLLLRCMDSIALCRIRLCFTALLVLHFITQSSLSIYLIILSRWKEAFSSSNVKDDIVHQGKNFQTESIFGTIKDDILLDGRTGWRHKGTMRS